MSEQISNVGAGAVFNAYHEYEGNRNEEAYDFFVADKVIEAVTPLIQAEYQRTQRNAVIDDLVQTCIDMARWEEQQGFHDTANAWDWMGGRLDTVLRHDGPPAELGAEDAEQGVRHDPAS